MPLRQLCFSFLNSRQCWRGGTKKNTARITSTSIYCKMLALEGWEKKKCFSRTIANHLCWPALSILDQFSAWRVYLTQFVLSKLLPRINKMFTYFGRRLAENTFDTWKEFPRGSRRQNNPEMFQDGQNTFSFFFFKISFGADLVALWILLGKTQSDYFQVSVIIQNCSD